MSEKFGISRFFNKLHNVDNVANKCLHKEEQN